MAEKESQPTKKLVSVLKEACKILLLFTFSARQLEKLKIIGFNSESFIGFIGLHTHTHGTAL
jgi:hypothetical protein